MSEQLTLPPQEKHTTANSPQAETSSEHTFKPAAAFEHTQSAEQHSRTIDDARHEVEAVFSSGELSARHGKAGEGPRWNDQGREHNPERAHAMALAEEKFRNLPAPDRKDFATDEAYAAEKHHVEQVKAARQEALRPKTAKENLKAFLHAFIHPIRSFKQWNREQIVKEDLRGDIHAAGRAYDRATGTRPTFVHDIDQAHAMAAAVHPYIVDMQRIKQEVKSRGVRGAIRQPKQLAKDLYTIVDRKAMGQLKQTDAARRYHGKQTIEDWLKSIDRRERPQR